MIRHITCHQEQLHHFRKSAELDFRNADAFINWGVALTILGRHEEALDVGPSTIRLVWLTLVQPYYKALEAFKINPTWQSNVALVFQNIGSAKYAIGRHQEAIEAFQECLRCVHVPRRGRLTAAQHQPEE